MIEVQTSRLRSITLNVRDADLSARFYEALFGWSRERDEGELIWMRTSNDGKGGSSLLLHTWPEPEPAEYGISLEVEVTSVDDSVEAATAAGATVSREPVSMDYGQREATVLDPDGYPIWLVQPLLP